jgi:hypothetical protein
MVFGEQDVSWGFAVPMHVREYELFYILDGELAVVDPEGETRNQSRRLREGALRHPARPPQSGRRPRLCS